MINLNNINIFIENNIIFDSIFIKWYMNKYYKLKISNDYNLMFLNEDIKYMNMNYKENDKGILIEKDKYIYL